MIILVMSWKLNNVIVLPPIDFVYPDVEYFICRTKQTVFQQYFETMEKIKQGEALRS